MSELIDLDTLPDFDGSRYLTDEKDIAAYLTGILEANDAGLLVAALGDIARARGMASIAAAAAVTREALYEALEQNAPPCSDTMSRVCKALGASIQAHQRPFEAGPP
ncbi:putative addiction module antidote protein [Oxalobacteraceae bacterium OTU3CAMAD1]|nr:putative addiction module antidote protein [Oxalobacteraceae bacterium OTU3CAMAD1]